MGKILVVNGVELPVPSSMVISDYDLTESERNAKGVMVAQIIRENVHKLECTWNVLRPAEYSLIREAIREKYGLETTFFIPDQNAEGTLAMYVGDRTTPIYMFEGGNMNAPVYKGFSVNFIEM